MTRAQQSIPAGKGISPVTSREWHDYTSYRGVDAQPTSREIVARLHARMATLGLMPAGDDTTPEENGENA